MDFQTTLSRPIVLLLFLCLSQLGGHCHPLGSPSQSSEQSEMQKLLDQLRNKILGVQTEMAQEQLQQNQGPTEARETKKAAPEGILAPQDSAFQALQRLRNPKMMRNSGCFGGRLDRIGSFSGLGCNVLKKY
ncbi:natriuretic peptides B [Nannospalax galili]|uniref:natriuretic peptides B n=1 Tax=Nannospalax galili TaxID=1026970 RepID=UPI0004ED628A|nr:natriuretic peptides B [Nannospalax galili]